MNVKVIEGTKERIQPFKGVVIQKKNTGISATLTVRKMSGSVAVERIFPLHSPRIDSIVLDRPVRSARLASTTCATSAVRLPVSTNVRLN